MSVIIFIIGLVALLLEEQIGGQHAVGIALMAVGAFLFFLQVIAFAAVSRKVKQIDNDFWGRKR